MGCMVAWLTPRCAKCPSEGHGRGYGDAEVAGPSPPGVEGESWTEVRTSVLHLSIFVGVCQVVLGVERPSHQRVPESVQRPRGVAFLLAPQMVRTPSFFTCTDQHGLGAVRGSCTPPTLLCHAGKHTSMGGNGSDFTTET